MKELNITAGCTATTFCPDGTTPNYQMAIFTMAARQYVLTLNALTPFPDYPATPVYFADVPATHIAFKFVQELVQLNVLDVSQSPPRYFYPDNPITRGASAPYVVRAILNDFSY